jgi:hypothetical protein
MAIARIPWRTVAERQIALEVIEIVPARKKTACVREKAVPVRNAGRFFRRS